MRYSNADAEVLLLLLYFFSLLRWVFPARSPLRFHGFFRCLLTLVTPPLKHVGAGRMT